ncbi:hypothetical protein SD10_17700 [Spirosoma radiotolerans]|uniref:Secretion system C-terminal sorting domain-containing protein n=2 Tax=Spirosoma radiotolerans TaxID=1379870 RepID=A0A0E3V8N9_9BACT|nr:hypothetical protein SD10_17700 [Spirosoma radiotolerans]
MFLVGPVKSFGQVIYSNTFTGASACPTQGNTPVVSANATGTPFTRSTVTCTAFTGVFNSATLNNTASINNSSYIEFSVTANANAKLNVTSLSFVRDASNSAPNQLEVRYSTDGFATSTSWGAAPITPTTGASTIWDFADFSVPGGTTLTFRFYPYGTQRADLGAGTASGTTGTFSVDNVTLNGTSPLPVNLVSFVGKASKNGVVLTWVTAWEEENQGFEVQKSMDAKSFEGAGFVDGKNSSKTQSVYEFTDQNVLPGLTYYYRLKQKDLNGETSTSKLVGVRAWADEQEAGIVIYPNPSQGMFTVSGNDLDKAGIHLYAPSGAEIPIQIAETENRQKLDIQVKTFLPPGIYFLTNNAPDGMGIKRLKVLFSK